ncbi:hypothetical protein FVE85_3548 [Porphyridium purpureum]|uniref:Uncharacterized protein n=1 Tax=Porphyridium purpureum TaxID=35688 RepID=A0A5J4YME7_PORPP|nr:hypothetical protein FVE85_3548 [Porphyridium purpureum]|eukprot:POR3369..scf249_10
MTKFGLRAVKEMLISQQASPWSTKVEPRFWTERKYGSAAERMLDFKVIEEFPWREWKEKRIQDRAVKMMRQDAKPVHKEESLAEGLVVMKKHEKRFIQEDAITGTRCGVTKLVTVKEAMKDVQAYDPLKKEMTAMNGLLPALNLVKELLHSDQRGSESQVCGMMHCDSELAKAWVEKGFLPKLMHLRKSHGISVAVLHEVYYEQRYGNCKLMFVHGVDNPANIFTKPLGPVKFGVMEKWMLDPGKPEPNVSAV